MYVYQAIKRTKENESIEGPRCMREVLYPHSTEDQVIAKLKRACEVYPGTWRIYRSVNRRDERKSKIELAKTLIDQLANPNGATDKSPESLWKTILMQPSNKAERLFLIDIDTNEQSYYNSICGLVQAELVESCQTPNGFHIVCRPFNPEVLKGLVNVEIKKDALLFIESFQT